MADQAAALALAAAADQAAAEAVALDRLVIVIAPNIFAVAMCCLDALPFMN